MSAPGATQAEPAEAHADEPGHHPTPRDYVRIGAVLAGITAMEVVISYVGGLPRFILIGSLTVLAISKFGLVVAWYMHLKFDSAMFRRMFVFGIVLAVSVFTLVLGLFALKGVDADLPNAVVGASS